MVAPVLGIPCGLKLALNQIKLPPLIGVPLKFDEFDDCAEHGGGVGSGPGGQLPEITKAIGMVWY